MASRITTTNAIAVGITLTALSPVPVLASFFDGNELYRVCGETDDSKEAFCAGYVGGVADYMGFDDPVRPQCIPRKATLRQLKDVAVAYLRDHPTERHLTAASLIESALRQGFCPANQ